MISYQTPFGVWGCVTVVSSLAKSPQSVLENLLCGVWGVEVHISPFSRPHDARVTFSLMIS